MDMGPYFSVSGRRKRQTGFLTSCFYMMVSAWLPNLALASFFSAGERTLKEGSCPGKPGLFSVSDPLRNV